jgi:hypothetical protein
MLLTITVPLGAAAEPVLLAAGGRHEVMSTSPVQPNARMTDEVISALP